MYKEYKKGKHLETSGRIDKILKDTGDRARSEKTAKSSSDIVKNIIGK